MVVKVYHNTTLFLYFSKVEEFWLVPKAPPLCYFLFRAAPFYLYCQVGTPAVA
jgi:hypothetical protein